MVTHIRSYKYQQYLSTAIYFCLSVQCLYIYLSILSICHLIMKYVLSSAVVTPIMIQTDRQMDRQVDSSFNRSIDAPKDRHRDQVEERQKKAKKIVKDKQRKDVNRLLFFKLRNPCSPLPPFCRRRKSRCFWDVFQPIFFVLTETNVYQACICHGILKI